MLLGVNIDHIATLRNARGGVEPSVEKAAEIAEENGASSITTHLREDRRHIKDEDVYSLIGKLKTRLNLEMAMAEDIQKIALDIKPYSICLVPEKRQEITTEGGLDVSGQLDKITEFIYSECYGYEEEEQEFQKLKKSAELAQSLGLKVNAGHGLNYENVHRMHEIQGLHELNIGHSIISRAVFTGLPEAVSLMNRLIK